MKYIFLFSSLLFLAASCSNSETFEEQILGEWQSYSFVINCDDPSSNVLFTMASEEGCMDLWGLTQCTSVAINSDGKGQMISTLDNETYTMDYTYTLNNSKQTIDFCQGEHCLEFALEDGLLVQIMDEDDCVCEFGYDKKD